MQAGSLKGSVRSSRLSTYDSVERIRPAPKTILFISHVNVKIYEESFSTFF
jgi:hypothetical protein